MKCIEKLMSTAIINRRVCTYTLSRRGMHAISEYSILYCWFLMDESSNAIALLPRFDRVTNDNLAISQTSGEKQRLPSAIISDFRGAGDQVFRRKSDRYIDILYTKFRIFTLIRCPLENLYYIFKRFLEIFQDFI